MSTALHRGKSRHCFGNCRFLSTTGHHSKNDKKAAFYLLQDMEEIRIRENRPLMMYSNGRDYFVSQEGTISSRRDTAYQITADDTQKLLQLISDYSLYAFDEEIRNGYLTLRGGHRVGMTGKTVLENGQIRTMKYIKSFNFRISREVIGAADKIMPYLLTGKISVIL
jgi:stage III sporulation protein AA